MTNSGMAVSQSDPCLFVSDWVVAVAFVDNILFWSTDEAYINKLGSKLHKQILLLKQEKHAAGMLGVDMTRAEGGYIEMKQTGLIDLILEALGLDSKLTIQRNGLLLRQSH